MKTLMMITFLVAVAAPLPGQSSGGTTGGGSTTGTGANAGATAGGPITDQTAPGGSFTNGGGAFANGSGGAAGTSTAPAVGGTNFSSPTQLAPVGTPNRAGVGRPTLGGASPSLGGLGSAAAGSLGQRTVITSEDTPAIGRGIVENVPTATPTAGTTNTGDVVVDDTASGSGAANTTFQSQQTGTATTTAGSAPAAVPAPAPAQTFTGTITTPVNAVSDVTTNTQVRTEEGTITFSSGAPE